MKVIKISSAKAEKIGEHIEKALKYMGKAMQCVDSLSEGENYDKEEEDEEEDWNSHERSVRHSRNSGRNRY